MARPLLFLDVDGVLALRGHAEDGFAEHEVRSSHGDVHTVLLNPQHGRWINALAKRFEIVWATGWEHDAPRLLGPLLDIPRFPVVEFDERPSIRTRFSKVEEIASWAGERRAAWVDDYFEPEALSWAASRPWPTLLVQPIATRGLERRHVDDLLRFAEHGSSDNEESDGEESDSEESDSEEPGPL